MKHFAARMEDFIRDSATNEKGCWLYQGRASRGYGRPTAPGGIQYYLHKASHGYWNGASYNGKWTLHKCGNTRCWNPQHLYAGGPKENAQDRVKFGKKPEKLTDELVVWVKFLARLGVSEEKIAKGFGTTSVTINQIKNGRTRRGVEIPDWMLKYLPA